MSKKVSFNEIFKQKGDITLYKKSQHLFVQGEYNDHIFILQSGLLKAYYTTTEGKERVKSFITPGNTIASLSAAFKKEVCQYSIIALQDAQVIKVPFELVMRSSNESHKTAKIIIDILLQLSIKKEQREFDFLCLSAEERYLKFKATSPQLFESVTQADIASYLGITPVALSRIKNRPHSK